MSEAGAPGREPAGFAADDYTPHGYLQNPYDAGPWWGLSAGGPLRSVEPCGFEWHPDRAPSAHAERGGLQVGVEVDGDLLLGPTDFARAGVALVSRLHTGRRQSFDFEHRGVRFELTFLLATRDAIACRARADRVAGAGRVRVVAVARATKRPRRNAGGVARPDGVAVAGEAGPWLAARVGARVEARGFAASLAELGAALGAETPAELAFDAYLEAPTVFGAAAAPLAATAGPAELWLAVGRGATPAAAFRAAADGLAAAPGALADHAAADAAFWAGAPRLAGDWPAHWRRGWVYDLETTRLLVYRPAGVFAGPWPSWMAYYPRVVLAENTLDMLRLGLADPDTAWAALETAFETAARAGWPNVPCLFANGVYNMVASDGSVCGTSPAWCLPFQNVWLLYLLRPERERLARVYPHLAAYLEWWLRHRVDAAGWVVYKCTWEAGEDATPRLDPQATGHADISGVIRPVELQAAVAHAARVLARMGRELGRDAGELARWEALYAEYRERTRRMWDPARGRFRDVLRATGRFSQSDATYWGRDVHHDALQLIPLLDEIAAPEQRAALAAQLDGFDASPWVLWPSWSYVVAEAARAAGRRDLAARLSWGIVDRVYRENDRRSLAEHARPLPGAAREYWPLDLAEWNAHEAYGWGANTLLHVLRYVVGFSPSETTGHEATRREGVEHAAPERWELELAPALPPALPGRRYRLENLRYRGRWLDLELRPLAAGPAAGATEVELWLTPAAALRVVGEGGREVAAERTAAGLRFSARGGELYRIAAG